MINDVLELEDHNLELISLNVVEENLVGSHTGKVFVVQKPHGTKMAGLEARVSDLIPEFLFGIRSESSQ